MGINNPSDALIMPNGHVSSEDGDGSLQATKAVARPDRCRGDYHEGDFDARLWPPTWAPGEVSGHIMARTNADCGDWVCEILHIEPNDSVLEVRLWTWRNY